MTHSLKFLPEIEENEVIVFGLFHCARDPRTIRLKLTDRNK